MLRTLSRIITALIILVLFIISIPLTASVLWHNDFYSDEAPGGEKKTQEGVIEITKQASEIKADEEVVRSIKTLLDGLNTETIIEKEHEIERIINMSAYEEAISAVIAEEAYEAKTKTEEPIVIQIGEILCSDEKIEIKTTVQGNEAEAESACQVSATPPSEEPSPYIPAEQPLPAADPWADFFIQGEDDLLLEDNVYYMSLYINKEYKGDVSVLLTNSIPHLYTDEIKTVVFDSITAEAYNRIFLGEGENISLEELEERGVESAYDLVAFRIDLTFSNQDMPVRTISIASRSYNFQQRALSGAEVLKPAVFTLKSSYGLSFSWSLKNHNAWSYMLGLSVRNEASLFDLFSDFSYTLRLTDNKFTFDFGSYLFRYDFPDAMLRLTWGNVFSGRTSPSGVPVGITLSKSIAYGRGNYTKRNDYNATIDVVTESEVEVFNEGNSIFKRTLQAGTYRLEDFVLYSGVNKVLIRITPVNGSAPTEIIKEFSYYSSMLSPGEFYYTLSFAIGREEITAESKRKGALAVPYSASKVLQYDIRNFGASFDMSIGITHTLSFAGGLSVSNIPTLRYLFNPSLRGDAEFTHMNPLGTTRYNATLNANRFEDGSFGVSSLTIRAGHQASTGWKYLSSVNLSASWSASQVKKEFDQHSFTAAVGVSGRLGFIGWSSGFSTNIQNTDTQNNSYSAYASFSTPIGRRGSLSTSMNLSGIYGKENPAFFISVYASISFKGGSVNASTSARHTRISANAYAASHSFSASLSAPGWSNPASFKDPDSYKFTAGYGTSFSVFGLSMGVAGDIRAKNLSGSVYISTSSIFADGLFAFTQVIPSSYLLIKQTGILKGNELSAGISGSSHFTILPTTFSTALYQGGTSTRATDLMLYSTPKDSMLMPSSFAVSLPAARGRGYVYRMATDPTYSVAVVVESDGRIWANGSSPLYRVEDDELASTDEYIFTDENGLMLTSGLKPGSYAFDVPSSDGWSLAVFTIEEDVKRAIGVNIYTCNEDENIPFVGSEAYSGAINLTFKENIPSDDFWKMLYPEAFEGDSK